MPELWMPEAVKHDLGDHALCDQNYPAKAIPHITWDKNGTELHPLALVPYENLVTYFADGGRAVAPHILWDPFTGRFTQFQPANSRSKSLVDLPGGTRTNRAGKVVIQIEALFFPYCTVGGKTYKYLKDTPCKGWPQLQNWVTSWGVPTRFPMGFPNGTSQRNEDTWRTQGGWYGHSQVPENSHTDPITWPAFNVTRTAPPFPGTVYFKLNAYNPYVTQVDTQLIRLGFVHYNDGNGYQAGPRYTTYTRDNVAAFQRSRGWSGSGADGYVGPQTWHDLFTV